MIDLFEAPLGSAPADPDRLAAVSPIPDEAFAHRGQWVAIREGRVIAARATLQDLYQAPEVKDSDVTCHIPPSPAFAFPA
jgi:hypothetical protein